ncbi:hypothetical protein CKAN_00462900 [Cinnamomum micranthum f. kanehirae]|uniref:Uncharacterized protein n=1 Tax=Cinnamomum micranthum f. kanehirae TaxID=337451 RepID=A0A3S3PZ07_9MAGN|nr:hypothetical protein CKAN_00462900 [Cinnamomum micranthum f. kanehirae]
MSLLLEPSEHLASWSIFERLVVTHQGNSLWPSCREFFELQHHTLLRLLEQMSGGDFPLQRGFKFDMIHPLYEGGKQKMRFIHRNITFLELVNIALESSHWEETYKNLSIHYLHHNGHMFSLAVIEDDSDIKCMLTLANHKANGIYLYINRRPIGSAKRIGEQTRYISYS